MSEKAKIAVVGSGCAGMSLAVLLAQNKGITVLDIDPEPVDQVSGREFTAADSDIKLFLRDGELSRRPSL